jgi:hypothetical protein
MVRIPLGELRNDICGLGRLVRPHLLDEFIDGLDCNGITVRQLYECRSLLLKNGIGPIERWVDKSDDSQASLEFTVQRRSAP